jgi:hypothetical protein
LISITRSLFKWHHNRKILHHWEEVKGAHQSLFRVRLEISRSAKSEGRRAQSTEQKQNTIILRVLRGLFFIITNLKGDRKVEGG